MGSREYESEKNSDKHMFLCQLILMRWWSDTAQLQFTGDTVLRLFLSKHRYTYVNMPTSPPIGIWFKWGVKFGYTRHGARTSIKALFSSLAGAANWTGVLTVCREDKQYSHVNSLYGSINQFGIVANNSSAIHHHQLCIVCTSHRSCAYLSR